MHGKDARDPTRYLPFQTVPYGFTKLGIAMNSRQVCHHSCRGREVFLSRLIPAQPRQAMSAPSSGANDFYPSACMHAACPPGASTPSLLDSSSSSCSLRLLPYLHACRVAIFFIVFFLDCLRIGIWIAIFKNIFTYVHFRPGATVIGIFMCTMVLKVDVLICWMCAYSWNEQKLCFEWCNFYTQQAQHF